MEDLLKLTNDFINKINPETKIVVKKSVPADIMTIDLREEQQGGINVNLEEVSSILCMPQVGCNSIFINEILVFVGGVVPKWDGVGDGWLLVDKAFPILVQPYLKEFFAGFNYYMSLLKYNRIQTGVLEGFDQGIRFIEGLGFKREGLMKQYGSDKKDYWRYAYLKNAE